MVIGRPIGEVRELIGRVCRTGERLRAAGRPVGQEEYRVVDGSFPDAFVLGVPCATLQQGTAREMSGMARGHVPATAPPPARATRAWCRRRADCSTSFRRPAVR